MRQAARKRFGQDKEIEARYNDEIGEVELFEFREVVETITDADTQILIVDARRDYDPDVESGDEIGVKLDTSGFGRILAQAAKQVIIQRIRDAERDNTFDEYTGRQGEIVNGIVRRFEKGAIIVDLGRAEAVIPAKEQVPRESYRPGDRISRVRRRSQQGCQGSADRLVSRVDRLSGQALRARSAGNVRKDRFDRVCGSGTRRAFEDRGRFA